MNGGLSQCLMQFNIQFIAGGDILHAQKLLPNYTELSIEFSPFCTWLIAFCKWKKVSDKWLEKSGDPYKFDPYLLNPVVCCVNLCSSVRRRVSLADCPE
jgi:hypothetical protein